MAANNGRDCKRWMENLPTEIKDMPFSRIAIPGSHDSASFDFDPALGVSITEEKIVRVLGSTCCGIRVVYNFSRTQNLSLTQQLEAGIRYLDLRVVVHPDTKEMRFVHGLYAGLVSDGLSEIYKFLDTNTKEVVIVHFQHLGNMGESDHKKLLSEISGTFQQKCFPSTYSLDPPLISLNALWKTPHRVMVFYQENDDTNALIAEDTHVWGDNLIISDWPNINDVDALIQYLQTTYETMQKDSKERKTMYVWQGIGSVKTKDIALHLCSTLETYIASEATERFVKWLKDGKQIGPKGINICIADFVEQHNYISTVVDLNYNESS